MDFKVFVDTLASIASIVAIVSVLLGWYRSARLPLKIVRTVVHQKQDKTTFILVAKNHQAYPVSIRRIDCYKRKIFEVKKKTGGKPEYSELLSSREALFMINTHHEIPAKANTDIRLEVAKIENVPSLFLFSIDTSHGYHELWCNDVTLVELGKSEVYSVDYANEYKSKIVAKFVYYWKVLVNIVMR